MSTNVSGWKAGLVVVSFWVVMMGFLAYRELGGVVLTSTGTTKPELREAHEVWMGLFTGGERIGHVRLNQAPEARHSLPGLVQAVEARARLNVLGRMSDLDVQGSLWRPFEARRAEFEFNVKSADYEFAVSGEVSGGMLRGAAVSAGETLPLTIPVDENLVFSSGFATALEFPALEVGQEVRLESFDPLTLQKSPMRVRCQAEETLQLGTETILARRLEVLASGMSSQVWIDENSEVVQMSTPFGLTLRRLRPEEIGVVETAPSNESLEILRLTAVKPRGKRPYRGARSSLMRIATSNGQRLPEDRAQQYVDDMTYRLSAPDAPLDRASLEHPAPEGYLRSDAFIQSDHSKIRQQSAKLVGEETDPWRRALAIHRWVYESIDKEAVVSIPSALEVLENRRGDCNEHTVLFVALARAADVPSRIAIGLVWSEDLEGFYYHAWPEVFVGDWIPMDPTLGQPLADATHVKLLNGGIESWTGLLAHLGQIEIEVLDMSGETMESL